MAWYTVMYVVGLVIAGCSSSKDVEYILTMVNPIAVTALVASLLMPFAAFGRNERVHKWLVQYAIVPIFGMYTVLAWQRGSLLGISILVGAGAVHFGYWLSSAQSRMYRVEQFRLGFAQSLPATTRVIARLNGLGESQISDEIIKSIFRDQPIPERVLSDARAIVGEKAVAAMRDEQLRVAD